MVPYIKEFLQGLHAKTGLACSLIIGGPTLASQGDISVVHVHEGCTAGSHPLNFRSYVHELFQSSLVPVFVEFLKKVYHVYFSPSMEIQMTDYGCSVLISRLKGTIQA
jgi:hypothetical protein